MRTAMAKLTTRDLPGYLTDLFEHFDESFTRVERYVAARLGGSHFTVRTDTAAYSGAVRRGLADDEASPHGRPCRIVAGAAASLGLPPAPVWAEPYYRERAVEASLADTRFRVHHVVDIGFWQMYDCESCRGIQIVDPARGLPPWDGGSPLRNFLHWHLAGPDRGLVHAGTLGVDGAGILLAGPGGSGKSGTVLAGISHGLETVGDDYVLARIDDAVTVHPLFRTLKQDPAGLARLGIAGRLAAQPLNWQGKHLLTIDDVTGRPQARGIVIRSLCVPTITGAPNTRFEPMGQKEAFLALAPSAVSQIPGDRGATFAFAADLARRLPAFRMLLGTDPAEIAASVRRFLARRSQVAA